MSEATQALHEIASEAECAEVRAEIAEDGAAIAEQRAKEAEEMAAQLFAASLETDHGRRISALETRVEAWLSSTKPSNELSAEMSQIRAELAALTTQVKSKMETLSIPPQSEQPTVTPEKETRPSAGGGQEKKEHPEKPKKGSHARARWI